MAETSLHARLSSPATPSSEKSWNSKSSSPSGFYYTHPRATSRQHVHEATSSRSLACTDLADSSPSSLSNRLGPKVMPLLERIDMESEGTANGHVNESLQNSFLGSNSSSPSSSSADTSAGSIEIGEVAEDRRPVVFTTEPSKLHYDANGTRSGYYQKGSTPPSSGSSSFSFADITAVDAIINDPARVAKEYQPGQSSTKQTLDEASAVSASLPHGQPFTTGDEAPVSALERDSPRTQAGITLRDAVLNNARRRDRDLNVKETERKINELLTPHVVQAFVTRIGHVKDELSVKFGEARLKDVFAPEQPRNGLGDPLSLSNNGQSLPPPIQEPRSTSFHSGPSLKGKERDFGSDRRSVQSLSPQRGRRLEEFDPSRSRPPLRPRSPVRRASPNGHYHSARRHSPFPHSPLIHSPRQHSSGDSRSPQRYSPRRNQSPPWEYPSRRQYSPQRQTTPSRRRSPDGGIEPMRPSSNGPRSPSPHRTQAGSLLSNLVPSHMFTAGSTVGPSGRGTDAILPPAVPPRPENPCDNVPGLWMVKVGSAWSTLLEVTFQVEPGLAYAWDIPLPWVSLTFFLAFARLTPPRDEDPATRRHRPPKIAVNLLCVSTAALSEMYDNLRDPTPADKANATFALECMWPPDNTLVVDIRGGEGGGGRSWLPYDMHAGSPIDVTDYIQAGANTIRLSLLQPMSDRTFILHASPRAPAPAPQIVGSGGTGLWDFSTTLTVLP
ncbi:unnamed protein product [Mycena citricolor]|uniref:Uncharacterized protein n=1 Tax=Mycena citricolor TaxID=2018698 RepID=A0AAD2H4X9_9AGAR|nr:unnamed protein product [Mycena citricolor]